MQDFTNISLLFDMVSAPVFPGYEEAQQINLRIIKRLATQELINQKDKDGNTPLHLIGKVKDWRDYYQGNIVSILLAAGARLDIVNNKKETPLHVLMANNNGDSKVLMTYIKAGADVNALNEDGCTPLDVLLKNKGDKQFRKILLENNGKTALPEFFIQ